MMEWISDKWHDHKPIILGMVMISLIGGGFGLLQSMTRPAEPAFPETVLVAEETETVAVQLDNQETSIMVDLKGAVKREGVYELSSHQRVQDVIDMAGGLLPEADPNSINLAQKLTDEAVIYVARQGEIPSPALANTAVQASQTDTQISLNKASASELQTISGIGAKRAQDIIAFREANGRFQSLDELKQVAGIGEKTFEKIQGALRLD